MDPLSLDKGDGGVGLRPRFRADLVAANVEEEGVAYVDVTDPQNGNYFRFYDFEYAIAREMDGERTLAEIAAWAQARFGFETTPQDLAGYAGKLEELGYLLSGGPIAAGLLQPGLGTGAEAVPLEPQPQGTITKTGAGGRTSVSFPPPPTLQSMPVQVPPSEVQVEAEAPPPPSRASDDFETPTRIQSPSDTESLVAQSRATAAAGGSSGIELGPTEKGSRPVRPPLPATDPAEVGLETIASAEAADVAVEVDADAVVAERPPGAPAVPVDALAPTAYGIPALEMTSPATSAGSGPSEGAPVAALGAGSGFTSAVPVASETRSLAVWIWLGGALFLLIVALIVLLVSPGILHPHAPKSVTPPPQAAVPPPRPAAPVPPRVKVLGGPALLAPMTGRTLAFQTHGVVAKLPAAGTLIAPGEEIAELGGVDALDTKIKSEQDRVDVYKKKQAQAEAAGDSAEQQKDASHISDHLQTITQLQQEEDGLRIVNGDQPARVAKVLVTVGAQVEKDTPVIELGAGPPVASFTLTANAPPDLVPGAACWARKVGDARIYKGDVASVDNGEVTCGDFHDASLVGQKLELVTAPQ